MSTVRDILIDKAIQAAPAGTYLSATVIMGYLPVVVSIMTAVLIGLQIYKAITEIRAAKRKEKSECNPSNQG
ncbi:hypothetical protein D3C77_34260 [compost metagenome]